MSIIQLSVADSFLKRLIGLIGVTEVKQDFALLIPRCKMVHTCAMKFPICVFFIGPHGQILKCIPHLVPWRLAYHPNAVAVIETKCFDVKDTRKWSDAIQQAYKILIKHEKALQRQSNH
jgi:uncharacterized membrane protein (UPF0127 family)